MWPIALTDTPYDVNLKKAPSSQAYDPSAAIWPQGTSAVRHCFQITVTTLRPELHVKKVRKTVRLIRSTPCLGSAEKRGEGKCSL